MTPAEPDAQSKNVSRRTFMQTSTAAVAGAVALDSQALGAGVHSGGSDVLRIGVIGCGGRGRGAAANAAEAGGAGVKIVALGDPFRGQIDRCYRRLQKEAGDALDVPEERKFVGLDAYKQVIDAGVDLVILASPPGFRPAHLEAAINAGKHVFAEKPLAVDGSGIRRVMAAAKEAKAKGLGVGVGLQRRHDPRYSEAIKRIQDGMIGDVLLSRVYWNSSGVWVRTRADLARMIGRMPNELEYQVYNWYYFNWLSGDHIVEQHIHNLDVGNWVRGMHPVSANGMGGREIRTGADTGQIYDHHAVEFTYPDGTTMLSQCRHQPGCWSAVHEDFAATRGRAELGGGRDCRVIAKDDEYAYQGAVRSPYVQEHVALQEAIRNGKPFNELDHGAEATMTSILGRLATYSGKVVSWDEALNSSIVLQPTDIATWADEPPVLPDDEGAYPIAVPGVTEVV